MTDYSHYRGLRHLHANTPVNRWLGSTATVLQGHADIRTPLRPEFLHDAHSVHASIYYGALSDAAALAANSLVEDVRVIPVSFSINIASLVCEGAMRARGWIRHEHRDLYVAESELRDAAGTLLATGSGVFCRSGIPLDDSAAYRESTALLPEPGDDGLWLSFDPLQAT